MQTFFNIFEIDSEFLLYSFDWCLSYLDVSFVCPIPAVRDLTTIEFTYTLSNRRRHLRLNAPNEKAGWADNAGNRITRSRYPRIVLLEKVSKLSYRPPNQQKACSINLIGVHGLR